MKKDVTMKKSTFVKGAFITTLGIVIAKILGIDEGGALYGYAYTIYSVFMSLASAGIPLAISKLVSEYQTLGYYNAKRRVFIIGKRIALILGLICFLIILICAPLLAKAVLGNVHGGSSIKDVTFVIRVIGTAILVVPVLSIYRGYFEGHRLFSPPSISQVIEQFVRVLIIIFGSFTALKVFKLDLTSSVGIALFGATVGAIFSYVYLVAKKFKNRSVFNEKVRKVNEPIISNKIILKKIVYYSIPFILIDVFKSLYNYVDMVTVVKGLVNYASYKVGDAEVVYSMLSTWSAKFNMIILSVSTGVVVSLIPNLTESVVKGLVHHASYKAGDAEIIYSMLSTWSAKFNMIIFSVSTGVVVSLIPNLTESVVKKDKEAINKKVNQALNILLFLTVPMTLGISFLAKPVWMLFYGKSVYGPSVLSYYIFVGLFIGLFTAMVSTLQTLKDYKAVFISLISGVILKILLTNYLLMSFYKMSLPPYYGVITASVIGYLVSFVVCLVILRSKYKINFEETIKSFFDIMCASILMILVLFVVKLFIPVYSSTRLMNLVIILVYMIIGMIVYFIYGYYTKLIKRVFGNGILRTVKKIIMKK